MLRLVILVLQLKYTIPTTKLYGPSYWKTTVATDKVIDYWNHGPVFIPGLQDVYGISTKVNDIIPAWLTKRTRGTSLPEHTGTLTSSSTKTTTHLTTKAIQVTEKATSQKAEPPKQIAENKETKKILTNATRRPKKTNQQSSFEEENYSQRDQRDPFSAFIRKLLKILSDRNPLELPAFFKPFISYMTELITDGDLKELGDTVVAYFEMVTDELNETLSTPDKLQTLCYEAHDKLMNRLDTIDENTNELLSFLDNMYNEAEEEVMHFVLHEMKEFPYSNITAEQIAYMFVNIVFLTPMNRISGTPKKDILVKKLTAAVAKRNTSLRRHFGNSHRKKKSRSDLRNKFKLNKDMRRFTESNYKSIRDNMENINNLIDKLKVGISSSDTSAYEYELSEDDDEADNIKVKQDETRMKKTTNNQIQILRTNDEESLLENDEYNKTMGYGQIHKVTPNINDIIQDLQGLLRVPDKSHVIPKESSINFRFGHIEKYQNNEPTVLVPNHLLTKLIKHRVPYDSITESSRKKPISSRYTYFNDARLRPITKPTKKVVHKLPTSREVKIKTQFNKLPLIDQTSNYPVHHQDTPGFKNKHIVNRIPLKRRPAYLDKRLKTIQPLKVNMLKLFSSQVTKYTPKTTKTVKSLRNGKIKSSRVQNTLKSTTKHNMNLGERLKNYLITLEPFSKQVTKHTPTTELTTKMVKSIRNRKIRFSRVRNTLKNTTKHKNMNHKQYKDIKEENEDESDDSDTYAEYSSEPLGRKPLNHRRSKYKKLKRKYNLLKRLNEQILAQNAIIIKHKQTSPEVIQKLRGKVDENINTKTKDSEEIYNQKHSKTPANAHRKIRINNINLFLDDYDGKIEFESDSQESLPFTKLDDYRDIIRKSFPLSTSTNNSTNTAIEYNDTEKELKHNDAITHRGFINYNASRRSDDVKPINDSNSHETDVEAVLKTNIYKAFKKLLKT